jgi:nucleoside-diphosphate-sugar epimerase
MTVSQAMVFGGAGFIGSHLVRSLVASKQYERVVAVDIGKPRFRVDGVEYVRHDVRKKIPLELAKGQPAKIFNLAAVHVTPGHQDWEYFDTNIQGAIEVCRFASLTSSCDIVFTSSISVYGPTEAPLTESDELKPTSAYGRSKAAAERIHALWQSEESGRRRLTIVRPAVIFGLQERGNFTRLSRLLKRGRFIYPGRTDTIKSCGYVRDLVSSMCYMSSLSEGQLVYNFSFGDRYSIHDICRAFCSVGGYTTPHLTAPIWLLNLAVLPFELAQGMGLETGIHRERVKKLYFSTNVLPQRLFESGFKFEYDLTTSLEDWRRISHSADFD